MTTPLATTPLDSFCINFSHDATKERLLYSIYATKVDEVNNSISIIKPIQTPIEMTLTGGLTDVVVALNKMFATHTPDLQQIYADKYKNTISSLSDSPTTASEQTIPETKPKPSILSRIPFFGKKSKIGGTLRKKTPKSRITRKYGTNASDI